MSIACRRCSNYIFILDLTPGFNGMGKNSCKTRRETSRFWDLVRFILDIWRCCFSTIPYPQGCVSPVFCAICHKVGITMNCILCWKMVCLHQHIIIEYNNDFGNNHQNLYCYIVTLMWPLANNIMQISHYIAIHRDEQYDCVYIYIFFFLFHWMHPLVW